MTSAHGQPALGVVERQPDGMSALVGISRCSVEPEGIGSITVFMDPAIAARFDLAGHS